MSFLSNCTSGGCGAKIGPGELNKLLSDLPDFSSPNLLVGFNQSDDAAVYKISKTHALVSTVDFFSPMVEDPYIFGRIAAANALSDVYAMGGDVLFALNIVCFPEKENIDQLGEILKGGAEKVQEANALLCGGHSIYDKEPKYGLSVTGQVELDKLLRNDTAQKGDILILTKALGVGIVMAANRAELASDLAVEKAIDSMQHLNRYAAEKLRDFTVNACTDITGFGFLAHACEMAAAQHSFKIYQDQLPYIVEAREYADEYLLTAAGQRNRHFVENKVDFDKIDFALQELMLDPQTSGGLLISVAKQDADLLLQKIQIDDPCAQIVGEVIERENLPIIFS